MPEDNITTQILIEIRNELRGIRGEHGSRLESIEHGFGALATRFEQVHGMVRHLEQTSADTAAEASDDRRAHHAAQMKAFQDVIEEVRSAREQKMRELESDVAALKTQMAQLLARSH